MIGRRMRYLLSQVRLSLSADSRVWNLEGSDQYSCQSFNSYLIQPYVSTPFQFSSFLWQARDPFKIRAFVWTLVFNKLNTNDRLRSIGPTSIFHRIAVWCVRIILYFTIICFFFVEVPVSFGTIYLGWVRRIGLVLHLLLLFCRWSLEVLDMRLIEIFCGSVGYSLY